MRDTAGLNVIFLPWFRPDSGPRQPGRRTGDQRFSVVMARVRSKGGKPTAEPEPVLLPQFPGDEFQEWVFPLEENQALFMDVADLPTDSQEAIRRLAIRTGPLREIGEYEALVDRQWWPAEPVSYWVSAIQRLRILVRLWQVIQTQDRDALNTMFQWQSADRPGWRFSPPDYSAEPMRVPERLAGDLGKAADIIQVARVALAVALNHGASVRLDLHVAGAGRTWNMGLRPQSLEAGLFLQFACAVAGSVNYGTCAACGRWFPRPDGRWFPGAKRRDSNHCSATCRKTAQRRRDRTRPPRPRQRRLF